MRICPQGKIQRARTRPRPRLPRTPAQAVVALALAKELLVLSQRRTLHSLAEGKSVYLPEGQMLHVSVPETEVLYAPVHRGAQFLGRWRREPYCPEGHILHVSGMRRRLPEADADMRYLPSGQIMHES